MENIENILKEVLNTSCLLENIYNTQNISVYYEKIHKFYVFYDEDKKLVLNLDQIKKYLKNKKTKTSLFFINLNNKLTLFYIENTNVNMKIRLREIIRTIYKFYQQYDAFAISSLVFLGQLIISFKGFNDSRYFKENIELKKNKEKVIYKLNKWLCYS